VRHKALDLLGDLALVGRPIAGRVEAHRAGHGLHQQLAMHLAEDA
jgi:UDP-3-O-[3-hydroxymyristoyl] N-acetylglucosamine deacetylase